MATTAETYTSRVLQAPRALLLLLIYTALVACGGSSSGGTTSSIPATPTPPTAFVSCDQGATARDGTSYSESSGAPDCFAHLLAEFDNLQGNGTIPSNARGVAIIYDAFFAAR